MKQIRLKKLEILNFKGIINKTVEFSDKTTVKGQNAIGKSSLYDSVLWVLFDKLANGNSATDIRPHDKDGKDIDFLDIVVSATFDVDGREIILKKTQKQKWVQKRGSSDKKFEGNENLFEINSIPKTLKDYKEYINENFCPEEIFMMCTNIMAFMKLDTKKRRAKLIGLTKGLTDADVIESDSKFLPLSDILRDGTIEELIKRSKGIIKQLNEKLKLIPARIDEQEKSKVSIDVAELELGKKSYMEQITEIDSKLSDLSKQYEEYQKASDGALEIKFAMSDLERAANAERQERIRIVNREFTDLQRQLRTIEDLISESERIILKHEKSNEFDEKTIKELADDWRKAKERKFDDSILICPYCKQEYQEEKKNEIKEDFERQKEKEISDILEKGNVLRKDISERKLAIESCKTAIEENKKSWEETNSLILEKEKELEESAKPIEVKQTPEYQELAKQLAEKETSMSQGNSASGSRKELNDKRLDLLLELDDINNQLAKAQRNVDIDERIAELQTEQIEASQEIADEEKTLALLEDFNRKKMTMLTDEVNKHFKLVSFRLFTEQINGGYSDVCQIIVNGSNYETCLNTGHKILADIDILTSLQRINEVSLPVVVDNSEALDSFNVPEIEGQMILLKVSDNKEMVVERG